MAQIGNVQWPPHEGDVIDVAVSVADVDVAKELVAAPGIVFRSQPIGVAVDSAEGVIVTLQ